jgi:hypothetical protein
MILINNIFYTTSIANKKHIQSRSTFSAFKNHNLDETDLINKVKPN